MDKRFEPRYADYAARVRESLAAQPLMSAVFGAEATLIEPGRVDVVVALRDEMLQPYGNVHGVIASAVADSAAGYAAQTLLAEGRDVVTVEYKINFLAPGVGTHIRASGYVVRPGRTLSFCAADIYAEDGTQSTLFAHLVTTMMAVTH